MRAGQNNGNPTWKRSAWTLKYCCTAAASVSHGLATDEQHLSVINITISTRLDTWVIKQRANYRVKRQKRLFKARGCCRCCSCTCSFILSWDPGCAAPFPHCFKLTELPAQWSNSNSCCINISKSIFQELCLPPGASATWTAKLLDIQDSLNQGRVWHINGVSKKKNRSNYTSKLTGIQ